MHRGYVKLWRKTMDSAWLHDPEYFAVWGWLILLATHKEIEMVFGGKKIMLKPGQLITGRQSLSKTTGVEEHKIERVLKVFENEQQIEQQKSNKNRLITILNWEIYQGNEQQDEHEMSNKRATTEQQLSTNKNIRIKEHKNINNILATEQVQSQVNEVMNIFYPINPTLNFGNKTQRNSIVDLIKAIGFEHVKFAAQYAVQIQGDQFAPTITTPLKLKNKLAELRNHFKKNNTNKSNSVTI